MERMLAGVATRRHARVNEPVGDDLDAQATSTSRSSVSRRFKAVTDAQLDELMSRDLCELDLAALLLDGVHFADACCVVALAIGADGTKVPVGVWLGVTENNTVVTALLADLVDRGLNTDGGLLVVIDGAKAPAAAVRKVFGDTAFIQRCTLHKRGVNRPSWLRQARVPGSAACLSRRRWLSMLVMTRAWRATSECQPRASASSRSARTSASCACRAGRNSVVVTKLSHCSQMLA
jgi:Transposase, Mutator family